MATTESKMATNTVAKQPALPVCCTLGEIQDFKFLWEIFFLNKTAQKKNTQWILLALLDASKLILAQY